MADEGANNREQEEATAAPTTMASRMHTSERGLRHSPAVRSSAPRSPADCSSMHNYTDASEPQHGAERGLSTEASAKTFDTEERDGDDLDGRQPRDEHPARLGGVQDATSSIYVVAARPHVHSMTARSTLAAPAEAASRWTPRLRRGPSATRHADPRSDLAGVKCCCHSLGWEQKKDDVSGTINRLFVASVRPPPPRESPVDTIVHAKYTSYPVDTCM